MGQTTTDELLRRMFVARGVTLVAGAVLLGLAALALLDSSVFWQTRFGPAIEGVAITAGAEAAFITVVGSFVTWVYMFQVSLREGGAKYAVGHLLVCVMLAPVALAGIILIPLLVHYDIERWREPPDGRCEPALDGPASGEDQTGDAASPAPAAPPSATSSLPGCAWSMALSAALLVVTPAFVCTCGHLDASVLPVTLPAALLAWRALVLANKRGSLLAPAILIAVVAGVVLGKNVADVVWLGHDPLWPFR
jgi:hypothetical protein